MKKNILIIKAITQPLLSWWLIGMQVLRVPTRPLTSRRVALLSPSSPPQMSLLACKPMPVRVLNGLPESVIQLLCGMTITSPLITQLSMQPSQGQRLLIAAFIQIILRQKIPLTLLTEQKAKPSKQRLMQWQRLLKMPLLPCNTRMQITQRLMQPLPKQMH